MRLCMKISWRINVSVEKHCVNKQTEMFVNNRKKVKIMNSTKTRKWLCYALSAAMGMSLMFVAPDSQAAKKKEKLAKKKLTIVQGQSKKIVIRNKKKKTVYKFSASNKKIKVSKTGKVKALKPGKAKVVVKAKYKKKTRKIGTVQITIKKKQKKTSSPKVTVTASANTNTNNDTNKPSDNKIKTPPAGVTTPTPTPQPSEEGPSIIYKNYFEDGDTNGFTGRGGSIEVCNSQNHTNGGMNCLLVNGRTDTWHGTSLALSKYVAVGETYQFSAWVKQDSGKTEKIAMKLQYTDKNGDVQYKNVAAGSDQGADCADGEWVELKGEYEIPENKGDLILYFEMPSSKDTSFYLDDVEIVGKKVEINEFTVSEQTYQKMVSDSLYSAGNNARLKAVIEKARAGKDVTLAYIGGSITEGALASPNSKCYAEVSATAFAKKYGKNDGEKVHFINAGMSGTPSDLGVVRYDRDVIRRLPTGDHPDILFIEFAVNDYGCVTKGGGYEGLIRQALKSGSAVVLIFSVFKKSAGGSVCETQYRPFGTHYDIPMISMGDAIMDYFKEKGFYDWYFGDNLHPNNTGYQLMSDCIMNLMDTVDKETAEKDNITDIDTMAPKLTAAYQGIKILDASTKADSDKAIGSIDAGSFNEKDTATGNFQYEYNGQKNASWFPDNWMHKTTSGSDSLKVTLTCKTLMFVYKQSSATNFGKADLYIDGVKKTTINCYNASGWNNGAVYVALTETEAKSHNIELKMAEGEENKNFTLMAIGYN